MYVAQVLVSHVLIWTGRFRANMWFTTLTSVCLVASFAVTVKSGIVAVAWSWVVAFPIACLPALVLAGRILEMKLREFFAVLAPATLACAVMAVAVIAIRRTLSGALHDGPALALEAAVGAATYFAVLILLYRKRVLGIVNAVFVRQG